MTKLFYLLFAFALCAFNWTTEVNSEVKHSIKIIHKGISETEPIACTLIEVKDETGLPVSYYMDVESVVCGDSQCRIDIVRIFWDEIGQYKKYELPPGVDLEKADGDHFTANDYEKLNTILKDESSSLIEVYKEEIVGVTGGEGVDAMTGATILLDTSSYVSGAVWTCYSLWHWVHGETKQIIRDITGDQLSNQTLLAYLDDEAYQRFALEQLKRKQIYSSRSINSVEQALTKNIDLLKSYLNYIEAGPQSIYTSSIAHVMSGLDSDNRLLCLNSILQSDATVSNGLISSLSNQLDTYTYQELHIYLRILDKREHLSPQDLDGLLPLLNHNQFLIARRVYWYLRDQKLSKKQIQVLDSFQEKWIDKL